jgi:hypothetical protein
MQRYNDERYKETEIWTYHWFGCVPNSHRVDISSTLFGTISTPLAFGLLNTELIFVEKAQGWVGAGRDVNE